MLTEWREKRRIESEIRKIQKRYKPDFKNAATDDDKYAIQEMCVGETEELWDRLDKIEKDRLFKKAMKYGIEVPKEWTDGRGYEEYRYGYWPRLTMLGGQKLRHEIRKSQRERIEWWITKAIVPVVGVITGLIGVLVALIALKYKK